MKSPKKKRLVAHGTWNGLFPLLFPNFSKRSGRGSDQAPNRSVTFSITLVGYILAYCIHTTHTDIHRHTHTLLRALGHCLVWVSAVIRIGLWPVGRTERTIGTIGTFGNDAETSSKWTPSERGGICSDSPWDEMMSSLVVAVYRVSGLR